MKFRDTLRLSFHNMWNNKTMTLLVTIVLLILSLLVSTIIAFSIDMTELSNKQLSSSDEAVDLKMSRRGREGRGQLTDDDLTLANTIYEENNKCFKSLVVRGFTEGKTINIGSRSHGEIGFISLDSDLMTGTKNTLNAGRLWNSSDKGQNNMWLSKNMAMDNGYSVGDTIPVTVIEWKENGHMDESTPVIFTIKGIVDINQRNSSNYDVYLGMDKLKDFGYGASELEMKSSPLFKPTINDMMSLDGLIKKNNTYDYRSNPDGLSVDSYRVENAKMTIIMSVAIIGASIFFSLIIILLSIGCISNAIQITVEQNRKFFGMMKAVGLRNKTVKSIVRWQAVIMILVAVIIASCITVGILAGVKPMIFEAMNIGDDIDIPFTLPFYVPFIVFAMQVLLVILFTNKSLNKISKMDVISVISEVN